jgi:hypothetical protein
LLECAHHSAYMRDLVDDERETLRRDIWQCLL